VAGFGILALAIVGAWRLWRVLPVVVLLMVYLNAAHAGLDSIGRYAVPVIPFYLLLATCTLMQWVPRAVRVPLVTHNGFHAPLGRPVAVARPEPAASAGESPRS
jgi:hypothetical protein